MAKEKNIYITGIIFFLIGFPSVLIPSLWKTHQNLLDAILQFFIQLGFAFIGLGIVAIILEFKNWKLYFQERLKDVVMQRSYLRTLSEEELISLQVDTLKTQYNETDIDREGSFLHYFQRKIQAYIGSPYREHVTCWLQITENKQNTDCFRVSEKIIYTCRSIGEGIQDNVKWVYEQDEIEKIDDININLSCYNQNSHKCNVQCKNKDICQDGKIKLIKSTLDKDHLLKDDLQKGYCIELKDIIWPADRLQVEINSCFDIKKDSLSSLVMTHPSKDATITITFPKEYNINCHVFGIEPAEYSKSNTDDMFTFKRDDWLLPRSGIAYKLVKK